MLAFILNLPWTLAGAIGALLSGPRCIRFSRHPLAIIVEVRSFWWYRWLPGMGGVRGMALGHVAILGPTADEADCYHELIHVEQYIRAPFVHHFLYMIESRKKGYRGNKYEVEAYGRAGNRYEAGPREN